MQISKHFYVLTGTGYIVKINSIQKCKCNDKGQVNLFEGCREPLVGVKWTNHQVEYTF